MTGLYNCQSVSKANTWRHFAAASHRRRCLCLHLLWPRCSHWCFILSSAFMVYGERGDMRQASSPPPAGLETGFLFLFLGAEWRHIKVSRSTTLTQQKREPQRECVFEKSLSVRLWLHIPTFSPQRNTFFVFFFCLLIFAIFSHDFITNWKKKKKKRQKCR